MSLSFIFSPDSHEVFAYFLKTVAQVSYDIRTSVAKFSHCKFAKISRRHSYDRRSSVARHILAINSLKFFKHV